MTAIIEFITGIIKLAVWLAIAVAAVALWGYNKLRACSENVKEALSNTVVVARKKIGLINQLMDVVRSYQGYEQFTTLKVSQDNSLSSLQQMYQESGTVLSTITGMAQRFPDLKANAQYHRLIDSIQSVEADLGNGRTRYNQKVKEFNVLRTSIPHVFYSHLLGFRAAEYFNEQAIESPDAGMQKAMISDAGERVNELLGRAGSAVAGAARNMAGHGRQVVKKGLPASMPFQRSNFTISMRKDSLRDQSRGPILTVYSWPALLQAKRMFSGREPPAGRHTTKLTVRLNVDSRIQTGQSYG